jgi:hypothetical protein
MHVLPTMSRARAFRTLAEARPRRLVSSRPTTSAIKCRHHFLRHFPGGFRDATYLAWERDYKVAAAERFREVFGRHRLRALVQHGAYREVASRVVSIEARTNLLFSFEKMALRDAARAPAGARKFAEGLLDWVESVGGRAAFERWCETIANLPRRQTRVLTWPVVTVVGFIARPDLHIFLKPNVTRRAAAAYGFDFRYASRPNWETYRSLLDFGNLLRRDLRDLRPRDAIDLQSFIWVLGSDEYPWKRG